MHRDGNSQNQKEMLEIKNTLKEVKYGLMGRLDISEIRISQLEDILIEKYQTEKKKKKRLKKREQIQELWNYKSYNIHGIGISEGEEGRKQENYLKQ